MPPYPSSMSLPHRPFAAGEIFAGLGEQVAQEPAAKAHLHQCPGRDLPVRCSPAVVALDGCRGASRIIRGSRPLFYDQKVYVPQGERTRLMPPATPAPFAPGDIVKCVFDRASGPRLPISEGQIYTVRAVRPPESPASAADGETTLVWLAGFERSFFAARFVLVARAPANDAPCEAVAVPRRMARVFRECAASHGCCDVHDLARAGFTAAQITEYADEARRLAGAPPAEGEAA